jgi:hypothetical protein
MTANVQHGGTYANVPQVAQDEISPIHSPYSTQDQTFSDQGIDAYTDHPGPAGAIQNEDAGVAHETSGLMGTYFAAYQIKLIN